jgi:hypothetical protein
VKKGAFGLALAVLVCAGSAHAANTAAFAQDVTRLHQGNGRVVNVWWLPVEYWVQAARERSYPEEEVAKVREAFARYSMLGIVDGRPTPKGEMTVSTHEEIAQRLRVRVRQQTVAPLHDFDSSVADVLPDLAYSLQVSLGPLRDALRILVFPNVDENGKALLSGARDGVFQVEYTLDPERKPLLFRWHAPLNAVVGSQTDPLTGEPLDASWRYNPWTGKKLR